MDKTLEIKNVAYNFSCIYDNSVLFDILNNKILNLIDKMKEINTLVAADSFLLEKQLTGEYLYKFKAKDGRIWKQEMLDVENNEDPLVSFYVITPFRYTEYITHKDIRLSCVDLIRNYKIKKIFCNWF